jgi:uncharacterized protein (TIGR00266 family)
LAAREKESAVRYEVKGGTTPVLEVKLAPGEQVVAESGELAWLHGPVQLETSTSGGMKKGGFLGAVQRALSGGTFFMTNYSVDSGEGAVTFAAKAPGEIRLVEVGGGREFVVHRDGFICCEPGVELSVFLQQSLGAGVFGGAGFILQKLSGQGQACVELHGDVVEYDLTPGEELRVHPGHVALFESTISVELTTVPGIKNKLFGGDGLFLASLTGTGRVWLQSITLPALAHALEPYIQIEADND